MGNVQPRKVLGRLLEHPKVDPKINATFEDRAHQFLSKWVLENIPKTLHEIQEEQMRLGMGRWIIRQVCAELSQALSYTEGTVAAKSAIRDRVRSASMMTFSSLDCCVRF